MAELGPRMRARPPVALGCAAAIAVVVAIIAIVAFGVTYLESGADSQEVTLGLRDSYALGTVTPIPTERLFVVRLAEGTFLALADLDDAARAAGRQGCRVAPIPRDDPRLPQLLAAHETRVSPAASGLQLLFAGCEGAIYDVTGLRIDGDGANLDRYAISSDRDGHLTVDLQDRTCSERSGEQPFQEVACRS